MTRRHGRPWPGRLWLLVVPAACCAGPPLLTGLATGRALTWSGLGLAVGALLAGALPAIRRLQRTGATLAPDAAGHVTQSPGKSGPVNRSNRRDQHAPLA